MSSPFSSNSTLISKIMSPFPANTTLIFKTSTGAYQTNPLTGNPEPVTENVEITAHLRRDTWWDKKDLERLPGVPATSIYMRGRSVEPKDLPKAIWKSEANPVGAVIDGLSGKFWLLPVIDSGWPEVNEAIGSPIQGWFQPD